MNGSQFKPVFRDTRVTVEQIFRECARGLTAAEVVDRYPRITETEVRAALAYTVDYLANDITVAAAWIKRRADACCPRVVVEAMSGNRHRKL